MFQIKLPFLHMRIQIGPCRTKSEILAEARRQVERAPDSAQARLCLVATLLENDQLDDSVKQWHEAQFLLAGDEKVSNDEELSQENAWSHYLLGCILSKAEVPELAIDEWKKASALDQYGIGDLAREKLKLL